jgi:uncharacterized damage-inducible protein DinB
MITAEYCRVMTDYNAWMNERLYALCGSIDDADRRSDRGAFFGSIHRTLNHVMYSDLAFMSRFTGDPAVVPELGVDIHDDYDELWRSRSSLDKRLCEWSSILAASWLAEDLTYTSKVDGIIRTVPRWVLVAHMLNHQTHHRGQITTILSQMGLDVGTTDIPFMPCFQS